MWPPSNGTEIRRKTKMHRRDAVGQPSSGHIVETAYIYKKAASV